jgi:hypothetical protein
VVQPMAITNLFSIICNHIMSVSDVMGDYSIGVLSIPEIERYELSGIII